MSRKVDILEVNNLSNDFQEANEEVQTSLIKVKKRIEKIHAMNSFSGKAANEAKRYFDELHLTILESFRGLFDDLEEDLKQHIKSFEAKVDASESTVIESNYLQDVKEDMNDVFNDLDKQDEIIHETIEEVSDISSATPPSFSDVNEWRKKAIEKLDELDEDLAAFTSEGNDTDVKELINQIEIAMNNAKTSEEEARFTDFEGVSKNSALAKLLDYNVDKIADREEMVDALMEKMENGADLSYTEREVIYQHIQNEILDKETREQIKETSHFIQNDNEKLKEYINDEILASEQALENEIVLLEQYLFAGNEQPSDLHKNTEERAALRSYQDMLENYYMTINEVKEYMSWDVGREDPLLARVEFVKFGIEGKTQFSGKGHMESEITIDHQQNIESDRFYDSRKDFIDFESKVDAVVVPGAYTNYSEVDYYYGQDPVTDRIDEEGEDLEKEVDTMTGQFLGSELLGAGLSLARKPVSISAQAFMSIGGEIHNQAEKAEQLKWKELKKPANKFKLEMQVNTRDSLEYVEDKHAKLHPTDETHEIIERWKAIHREDPNFPYDEEAITNQKWTEMYDLFNDGPDDKEPDLNEHDLQLYNYLLDGTPSDDNEIIQKLMNEKR